MTDDLIARLREVGRDGVWKSGRKDNIHPMCAEAADEIEKLQSTLEKVRRSALTLTETQRQIYDHYQKVSTINKEAVSTLDSERECNALLTAEVEAIRAALEPFSSFAATFVDDDGWKHPPMKERIVDWFGPSDFRRAASAYHLRAQEGSAGGEGL